MPSSPLSHFLHYSSSIYYITTDGDGRYTYVNRLFSQIFGNEQTNIQGRSFCEDIYKEDVELCVDAIEQCLERPGETVCVDLRKRRDDGSMFWTRWEFCADPVHPDKTSSIHGIGNDITERKRAESENLKAQESLRLLLDNTDESFIMVNDQLEIISYNKAADIRMRTMLGKHLRKGFSILDYTSPERRESLTQVYKKVLEGHEYETETEIPFNGHKVIYFNHFKPVYNADKKIFAIIITSRDVTENKIAQEKLVQNEKHFRSLIENSADALTILSPEGEVLDISPSAERILGYAKEKITFAESTDLIHPDDVPLINNTFEEVVQKTDSIKTIEYRAKSADGNYKWLAGTYHNLLHEPSIKGIVLNFSDISKRKQAEQALQESEEKYRLLFYMNPQPMWIFEEDSLRFLEVNEAAIKHYGYSKEEFLSMTITAIRPDPEVRKLLSHLQSEKDQTSPLLTNTLWRHRKKNGQIILVDIKSNRINYNNRMARLVLAIDVTATVSAQEKLEISNQRFAYAAKATSDAIWEWDVKNDSMYVGDTYREIFGWDFSKERKIQDWRGYIHPDDMEVADSFYNTVRDPSKDLWEREYRYLRADGTYAHVVDRGYILRNDKGKALKVVGAIRDITGRKEAEEKLSRERHLLRTLIDHLPDYIYVKDVNFRHVINNKANVELIGAHSEEETLGKTVIDYFGTTAERYLDHDKKVMESGIPVNNMEEAITTTEGETRWLLTTKVPLKDEKHKVIGLVGISRDITERKKIEESLRASHERYNMAIRATNDAIWDADLKSKTLNWGEGFETLFGYKLKDLPKDSSSWTDKIHPEDKERVLERQYASIDNKDESTWMDEYRFIRADGSIANVIDRGLILRDDKGIAYRMVGAMMDITERKQLEAQLAEQLINRQRQITEAAIQAQEKERGEIGRELHDNINQILTTTKLYIDMAINEEDIRLELLKKSHSNISSAIEEIRILSKSLVPPSLGDIGIREAITEMITNLNLAQKLQIKLKTTGISNAIIDDRIKLMVFRIVQEQLNNIIKHSKATEANIKLAVNEKILNITIEDNGIGFDPKKKTKGIGLGNITSRAELHDGEVIIDTAPGKGCVLKVNIPI